jgi:chemotaxis protein histidine kinase CheA
MEMVRMVMKLREEHIRQVSGVEAYQLDDGRLVPMIRLGDLFVGANDEHEQKEFLMLVEAHGISACLVTNEPLGFQDVVIKLLPEPLNRIEVLMGVAELGDGSLATVIDVQKLLATSFKHVPSSMRREFGIKRYEPTKETLMHLLVFELAGKLFAAPVEQVAEVVSGCELLRLPCMPHPIEGVIEWHGIRVPVVKLRVVLGLEQKPFDPEEKLIVANVEGKQFAFAVDRLVDVVTVELGHVHQLLNIEGVRGIARCGIRGREFDCILIDLSYLASSINITPDTKSNP